LLRVELVARSVRSPALVVAYHVRDWLFIDSTARSLDFVVPAKFRCRTAVPMFGAAY
jgi:hypothetical protein